MPVSHYGDEQQKKSDQQQAGGFRGIDCVAAMLVAGIVLAIIYHVDIVRRTQTCGGLGATLRVVFGCPMSMLDSQGNQTVKIARFGVFELNFAAGELRKNGAKLRLQEQPFRVLVLLLERTGDVVTREEIRQKLWPADTFVDFDHSLNTAVNKLREVLGDSASSPRYIETLARRGYRFIAPVQTEDQSWSEHGGNFFTLEIGSARFASGTGSPDSASRSDARTVCSVPGNVSRLLFGRSFSAACRARNRRFFSVGMARDSIGKWSDGNSRSWNPPALLSAVCRGL